MNEFTELFNAIAMSFKDSSKWLNEVLKYRTWFYAFAFYPADTTIVVRNDQKR